MSSLSRKDDQRLRELLIRKADTLASETLEANGDVRVEAMESTEHLARVIAVRGKARGLVPRKRWPALVALTGTLALLSILLFSRVPHTQVALDVALAEVSFVLPTQQVLTEEINVAAAGLSGLQRIRMPGTVGPRTADSATGSEYALSLSVASNGEGRAMTLAPIALPAETRIWLRQAPNSDRHHLSFRSGPATLGIGVDGPVKVGISGSPMEIVDFGSPKLIQIETGSDVVDLDLTPSGGSKPRFSRQLPVSGLTLFRVEEYGDLERTILRQVSTVESGALYFESLDGEERPLRAGEALAFEEAAGTISTLRFHDGRINISFQGRVRGMTTGFGANRRSLMPSYLEWLQARHSLSLLWGATLYLFGLIAAALHWWGIRL